ncbi:MAG: glycosyltransferase family 2 protein [Prevotella sp.]|nr:glycosyltransferase family 2 protein [Prevotella sp.]
MKLSIIIVSYNVKNYLQQCLDSVQRAIDGIDAKIIIVDNHSKDNTVECIRKNHKNIKIISCKHNYGFAHANNMAIGKAKSEYVLLINPDTFVGENTIKECLEFMDAHENAGGLGVRMLKCDGSSALESRRGLPSPMVSFYKMCGLCAKFPTSKRFGKYYMGYLPWDEPEQIEVISGAFIMLRREALNKVGLLDEDFFMYGEDIDLSFRLLKSGYENWYLPTKILHYKGESTQKSSFRYVHVFYQAMIIFFRKHYGHLSFWINIPIKTAIYVKAFFALMKIWSEQIKKTLGFFSYKNKKIPSFLFFANESSLAKCRRIADHNGLTAEFFQCDEQSVPDGHLHFIEGIDIQTTTYAVYDISSYKYETILENFSKNNNNPNLLIGTYHPEYNMIITDNEIIKL